MKLAIYDFDGTYISVQTLPFLFKLWKQKDVNNDAHKKYWGKIMRRFLLHKLHLFGWSKPHFRANAMELTADLFRTVNRETLNEFLEEFYQAIKTHISPRMKQQLMLDNQAGYHTVLLSGNYDIILKPFLKDGFGDVIGTKIEEGDDLLKSEDVNIIIHQRKQDIIKEQFQEADFSSSKAYADSDYDLPIFEIVGHPIAVNPDKRLRKIALERGFEIIETPTKKV